ncbi:MAG: hypothetical protein IIA75_03440 [Proteobacteria bacterium]|nr:hypothetical protein [Pseudomonadota bacterium]
MLFTLLRLEDSYEKLVTEIFDTYLKGENPINRGVMYQKLYAGLTAQHPDYIIMGLISAFDIALWDICGKYYDTPVYNLLGGKYRDRIRTYTYHLRCQKSDKLEGSHCGLDNQSTTTR